MEGIRRTQEGTARAAGQEDGWAREEAGGAGTGPGWARGVAAGLGAILLGLVCFLVAAACLACAAAAVLLREPVLVAVACAVAAVFWALVGVRGNVRVLLRSPGQPGTDLLLAAPALVADRWRRRSRTPEQHRAAQQRQEAAGRVLRGVLLLGCLGTAALSAVAALVHPESVAGIPTRLLLVTALVAVGCTALVSPRARRMLLGPGPRRGGRDGAPRA